jgi:hypothetical protein
MTNTAEAFKASLLTKSTTEVQSLYDATEFALLNESYGSDDEARYDDMNERSWLYQELKRRKDAPAGTQKLENSQRIAKVNADADAAATAAKPLASPNSAIIN